MTYRQLYEQRTGACVPKNWDVHHIDCNRDNNDIRNLVAIPKSLHMRWHTAKAQYDQHAELMRYPGAASNRHNVERLKKHIDKLSAVSKEIVPYIAAREEQLYWGDKK